MKNLILALLLLVPSIALSGLPPVRFAPVGSSPNSSGGIAVGNKITLEPANASFPGVLLSSDWNIFNSKQPAGNYITGLTGDVSATGPGSVNAVIPPLASEVYVHLVSGDDTNGTGSILRPWKTIQHTCDSISPSINVPVVIHVEGGNNDTDTYPIVCPPNIEIVSDYGIQIHGVTISGGSTNDGVSFTNIIFLDNVTWIRNNATIINMTLNNSSTFGTLDFEQQGSGKSGTFFIAYGANTALAGFTFQGAEAIFQGAGLLYGTFNFKDSGSAFLIISGGVDLFSLTMQLNGGVFAELAGDIADAGFTISGTSTTSGTPTIMSDSGSVPSDSSITGSFTKLPNSQASWENYTPSASAQWSSIPATVNTALDSVRILSQSASGSQPTCTVSNRGLQWLIQGGTGVADVYQICEKDVSDNYVWVTH